MTAPMSSAQLKGGVMATAPSERANRSVGAVKGKSVAPVVTAPVVAARAAEPAINTTSVAAAAAPAVLPGGSGGQPVGSDINPHRSGGQKRRPASTSTGGTLKHGGEVGSCTTRCPRQTVLAPHGRPGGKRRSGRHPGRAPTPANRGSAVGTPC